MKERPILMSAPMVLALLDDRKTKTRRAVKDPYWTGSLTGDCPHERQTDCDAALAAICPYGVPGDRLWVREAWRMPAPFDIYSPTVAATKVSRDFGPNVFYEADGAVRSAGTHTGQPGKTRVSIHMPRWASRITLEITGVRVEQLQEISAEDAIAEGLYKSYPDDSDREWFQSHRADEGHTPTPEEWAQFEEGVWMVPGVPQGWGMTLEQRQRDTWAPTPEFAYRLLWEHINGTGSWAANPWVWVIEFRRV